MLSSNSVAITLILQCFRITLGDSRSDKAPGPITISYTIENKLQWYATACLDCIASLSLVPQDWRGRSMSQCAIATLLPDEEDLYLHP